MTVGTDQLSVDLLNLDASTKYCIQLAGFTRIGDGNRSTCFYVTTAEKSGKLRYNYVDLLHTTFIRMFQWRAAFGVTMRGTMIMKTTTTMP